MIYPTAYFPSIQYLREVCTSSLITIDTNEHWIKQSIRNRAEILTAEGIQRLVVPIIHNQEKQAIHEVKVAEDGWEIKHWRAIKTAYGKAPYFEAYDLEIEALLIHKPALLLELNHRILKFFINAWELPIQFCETNSFHPYTRNDNRLKNWLERTSTKEYQQVFSYNKPFTPNLSVLDLLFCEGPLGRNFILD
jgi:hypothetical protein